MYYLPRSTELYWGRLEMFHIVDYHGCGGQACINAYRTFTDPEKAEKFAEEKRGEPGHNCGPKSVRVRTSEINEGNGTRPEISFYH